ncbi:MAG TPA: MoxR family ATPase [Amycolatopsis sp.]|uniref:AAA family ATPase n=1 Tax=Amycolatopsis sp. TaxID=37632 RepID=UPI002B48B41C|nr:MoxR family ATPase [Amycolatopsis sp.]HKS47757.1 MoxR family ATPase [Amycolatopsis sp.]
MNPGSDTPPEWRVYHGTGWPSGSPPSLPKAPPWREFDGEGVAELPEDDHGEFDRRLGKAKGHRVPHRNEISMVNAALYLRRPLLVTGRPGTGKSSLAYQIARELGLGPVLRWPITSRTTLRDGLYGYDAIGRVQDAGTSTGRDGQSGAAPDIGNYVHLGPLGTALLPFERPRVLLIDELDKSDIDLPNDLLNVFEEGEYEIPELIRIAKRAPEVRVLTADRDGSAVISGGVVCCRCFPVVIITSNGERDFPPAFLRRCLNLRIEPPTAQQLGAMVAAQFGATDKVDIARLITEFTERSDELGGLASDQLLNAVHLATELATSGAYQTDEEWQELLKAIWHPLSEGAP